jgi:hypothetical protein
MDRNDEVRVEGIKRASAKARKMKAKGGAMFGVIVITCL